MPAIAAAVAASFEAVPFEAVPFEAAELEAAVPEAAELEAAELEAAVPEAALSEAFGLEASLLDSSAGSSHRDALRCVKPCRLVPPVIWYALLAGLPASTFAKASPLEPPEFPRVPGSLPGLADPAPAAGCAAGLIASAISLPRQPSVR